MHKPYSLWYGYTLNRKTSHKAHPRWKPHQIFILKWTLLSRKWFLGTTSLCVTHSWTWNTVLIIVHYWELDPYLYDIPVWERACGSVVVETLCYKLEGHGFETLWGELIFSVYLILPAALHPGIHSASKKWVPEAEKYCFCGIERSQCIGLIALPPSVSDCLDDVGSLTSHNPIGLHSLLQG
jgi:hypothetical protein